MNRSPSLSAKRVASPNLSAFRRWVLAFCVIRFDLEQGQTVEDCYPPDSLPPDQQLFVAFSSFPDSMSHHHPRHRSSIHDSIFSFRFPAAGAGSFIYGYVFNRQRQDARLPRGGEQNSVVVLSHYPYSSVFRPLLQILGPCASTSAAPPLTSSPPGLPPPLAPPWTFPSAAPPSASTFHPSRTTSPPPPSPPPTPPSSTASSTTPTSSPPSAAFSSTSGPSGSSCSLASPSSSSPPPLPSAPRPSPPSSASSPLYFAASPPTSLSTTPTSPASIPSARATASLPWSSVSPIYSS